METEILSMSRVIWGRYASPPNKKPRNSEIQLKYFKNIRPDENIENLRDIAQLTTSTPSRNETEEDLRRLGSAIL